jgi:hypothetical protein
MKRLMLRTITASLLSLASLLSVTSALAQAPPSGSDDPLPPASLPPPAPGYYYLPRVDAPDTAVYRTDTEEPEDMPYRGLPVPAGYHLESRLNRAPIITGSAILGGFYIISLGFAIHPESQEDSELLYIPIAGPFIQAAVVGGEERRECIDECDGFRKLAAIALVADGIVQTAGAITLIVGLALPKQVLVRDGIAGVPLTIAPMTLGRGGFGLGLAGKL